MLIEFRSKCLKRIDEILEWCLGFGGIAHNAQQPWELLPLLLTCKKEWEDGFGVAVVYHEVVIKS